MIDNPKLAHVDESSHVSPGQPGVYVLAAVVTGESAGAELVDSLRSSVQVGRSRLHWHDDSPVIRRSTLERVAAAGADVVVVAMRPVGPKDQERARGKCLERLMAELEARGVDEVVVESRGLRLDRDDVRRVDAFRTRRIISSLTVTFARASENALLWTADAAASSCSGVLNGGPAAAAEPLWDAVAVIEV